MQIAPSKRPFSPHRLPLPEMAVEAMGLSKTYGSERSQTAKPALDEIDLAIPRGSRFGLLGPNGAGKSTFINILAGLVRKSSGAAHVWGVDIDTDHRRARAAIGVVPQELNIDPFFTPIELLDLHAGLYGVPAHERRSREILAAVGLVDKADAYARTLSGGMRRRLMVAKAMVHNPPVLVLDEPTAGVDVELRRKIWDYICELNEQGTTILLTTQYHQEAEELCDRIAIINHGRVVACDTTPALLARIDSKELAVTVDRDLDAVPDTLAAYTVTLHHPRRLVIHYSPHQTPIGELLAAIAADGLSILDLSTEETDLEDLFLHLTHSAPGTAASPS